MTSKIAPLLSWCLLVTFAPGCGDGVALNPGGGNGGGGGGGGAGGHVGQFPAASCGQLGSGSARAVAYAPLAPRGQELAVAYGSGAVVIYAAADASTVRRLIGHDAGANAVAYSPDGALLATGGDDGTIKVWRTADGSLAWSAVADHVGGVTSVAFSIDGARVASTGIEGVLSLWGAADGAPVWSLALGMGSQQTVFFTPDGDTVVSHPYGGTLVQFRRVADGAVAREVGLGGLVRLGALSPDGSLLFGFLDGPLTGHSVAAYRASDGTRAWSAQNAHTNNIMGVV